MGNVKLLPTSFILRKYKPSYSLLREASIFLQLLKAFPPVQLWQPSIAAILSRVQERAFLAARDSPTQFRLFSLQTLDS